MHTLCTFLVRSCFAVTQHGVFLPIHATFILLLTCETNNLLQDSHAAYNNVLTNLPDLLLTSNKYCSSLHT